MEMIIIVCLITVIALLLHDKLGKSKSGQMDNIALSKDDKYSKDIIGKPKLVERMSQKNDNLEGMSEQIFPVASEETQIDMESFKQQQIKDSVAYVPDFEEEEKELWAEGDFYDDNKFATGVTFEELSAMNTVLLKTKDNLTPHNSTVQTVHKLEGTELLQLLESNIGGASQKIAMLLNNGLSAHNDIQHFLLRNNGDGEFEIKDFV